MFVCIDHGAWFTCLVHNHCLPSIHLMAACFTPLSSDSLTFVTVSFTAASCSAPFVTNMSHLSHSFVFFTFPKTTNQFFPPKGHTHTKMKIMRTFKSMRWCTHTHTHTHAHHVQCRGGSRFFRTWIIRIPRQFKFTSFERILLGVDFLN